MKTRKKMLGWMMAIALVCGLAGSLPAAAAKVRTCPYAKSNNCVRYKNGNCSTRYHKRSKYCKPAPRARKQSASASQSYGPHHSEGHDWGGGYHH